MRRTLEKRERRLIEWLLRNAATTPDAASLLDAVAGLHVVDGCACGCPSVDFEVGGQDAQASIIADALGTSPEGLPVGVLLWAKEGRISGLEVYPFEDAERVGLPDPEKLKPVFGLGEV
ncbi:MAG TPA: hypothetical protein VD930_02110 [Gemmatimonadales bacterium]|nr:hypothetical protein [Gemmatimonadales bacterium]